jgi:hypothetical protein
MQNEFEALLIGLTDEDLAMLKAVTKRRLTEAIKDENEQLAFLLAGDLPPINAELEQRKARP